MKNESNFNCYSMLFLRGKERVLIETTAIAIG